MKEIKEILLRHAKPFLLFLPFLRDNFFKGLTEMKEMKEIFTSPCEVLSVHFRAFCVTIF
jgi:hypothetical protein